MTDILDVCIGIDTHFSNIRRECTYVNKYATDIRYPHKYEVNEADASSCINAVEKIMDFPPIKELIAETQGIES